MRARSWTAIAWVALAATADDARAQASTERGPARVALASIQGPGLDFARLSHLFDAARVRMAAVLAPRGEAAPRGPGEARRRVRLVIGPEPTGYSLRGRASPPAPVLRQPVVATPAYLRTFRVLLSKPAVTDRYDEPIQRFARRYGLDPRLLKAVIAAESEFVYSAVSPKGARGLMQVMPATAEGMGLDSARLHDPEVNIGAGAAYLSYLFTQAFRRYKLKGVSFRDAPLWLKQRVIAAYNAGPRFLFRSSWYRETRHYVRKVLLFYQSRVTDFRRPPEGLAGLPALPAAPFSGGLY